MQIKNMSLSYGIHKIFDNVNLFIDENDKIGVVGVNGAGKSTFFNVLAGKLELDSGKITLSKNERIELLEQVINEDTTNINLTVFDYLLTGRPIEKLSKELETVYEKISVEEDDKIRDILFKKAEKIENKLNYYEYQRSETTLLKIIDGMKIQDEILDKTIKELSGGQKSKVAFARLLYSKPEIMLLDEPTNHLDKDTKDYVVSFLKNYKGSVFIISHDMEFLNLVTNKTLYIDKQNKNMELFNGNYDKFIKDHNLKMDFLEKESKKQEEEIEKLENIVNKYKTSSGKRKRMAMDREKKLEKLKDNKIEIVKTKETKFSVEIDKIGNKVPLRVENLSFKYPLNDKILIDNLSFTLDRGEKFLIIGENGVGKSTLLKLLVGQLKALNGEIKYAPNTSISYYAQEHELLDSEKSIIDNFKEIDISIGNLRNVLARFLFFNDDIYKKIKVLSPGERARVALAKVSLSKANLLILDEPTNHLDIETKKIIADTFKSYNGTMLVVSHDTEFLKNIQISRVLTLPSGKISYYDNDKVSYYEKINTKEKN